MYLPINKNVVRGAGTPNYSMITRNHSMNIYLYVKQCQHCGLKYFGKTINSEVEKYSGSGKYWLNHINSHGRNLVTTVKIWHFDNQDAATDFALNFSSENKIVESKEWANLVLEDGKDGNSKQVITQELRNKFKRANTGKNNPMYGTIWITDGVFNKKIKSSDGIPSGWVKGRTFTEEHQTKFNKRCQKGSANSHYDPTVRHWINVETGEEIKLPKYDFCQQKMLNGRKIREVVQGKIEHYQGWKLIS